MRVTGQVTPVELERNFLCPQCWEPQTVLLDLSAGGDQRFVQDCTVCCNPIEFVVVVRGGKLAGFSADGANG